MLFRIYVLALCGELERLRIIRGKRIRTRWTTLYYEAAGLLEESELVVSYRSIKDNISECETMCPGTKMIV